MEPQTQTEGRSSFVRKLILIVVFFTITPLTLISTISSLVFISDANKVPIKDKQSPFVITRPKIRGAQVFTSRTAEFPSISAEIIAEDARAEIVKQYLADRDSPLAPYASFIVETADKYSLDYRLITAIAQKESGLGRAMPSENCNNAWGYGIHSEGTLCFDTWEEGIETVSKGLKENYLDQGYITVEQIMKKYAHPLSTTWAEGVAQYMSQME